MKTIFLASLMIVIAAPISAMDNAQTATKPFWQKVEIDDPDRYVPSNLIELATIESNAIPNSSALSNDNDNNQESIEDQKQPIHIINMPPAVNIPPQDNSALKAIASTLGRIRWQQYGSGINTGIQTIAIACMLCSAGDKISGAISNLRPECKCTCPTCPNINIATAPIPMMMMRTDTMPNSTLGNSTTTNDTTTYFSNSTAFTTMIANMTKEKMD